MFIAYRTKGITSQKINGPQDVLFRLQYHCKTFNSCVADFTCNFSLSPQVWKRNTYLQLMSQSIFQKECPQIRKIKTLERIELMILPKMQYEVTLGITFLYFLNFLIFTLPNIQAVQNIETFQSIFTYYDKVSGNWIPERSFMLHRFAVFAFEEEVELLKLQLLYSQSIMAKVYKSFTRFPVSQQ